MNVVLVNLRRSKTKQMPPLGLMYLASSLKSVENMHVKLLDEEIDPQSSSSVESVAADIISEKPDILCFTTSTEQHRSLAGVIAQCRMLSDKPIGIVVGGPHATLASESCARTMGADMVFRGPGERLLPDVIASLVGTLGRSGFPVEGCRIIEMPVTKSDDLKLPEFFPDRGCVNLQEYKHPFTIMTARGCMGKCAFCSSPTISNGFVHNRRIESIEREVALLSTGFKARKVAILDDSFTHSPERLRALCNCLVRNNLKWFCESRIDCVNEHMLQMMFEAGCSELQFGVECFEQDTLDRIGKNIRSGDIPRVLGHAADLGIRVAVSLMIGLPGDTVSSVKRRIARAVSLADIGVSVIEFGFLRPFPGTEIYRRSVEFGYGNVTNWWERDLEHPLCFPTSTMTRSELIGMMMYATYKVHEALGAGGQSDGRVVMPAGVKI